MHYFEQWFEKLTIPNLSNMIKSPKELLKKAFTAGYECGKHDGFYEGYENGRQDEYQIRNVKGKS